MLNKALLCTAILTLSATIGAAAPVTAEPRDLKPTVRTPDFYATHRHERDLMISVCRTGRVAIASTQACVNAYVGLLEEAMRNRPACSASGC